MPFSCVLPTCFKPSFADDLLRLGRTNDGGYVVKSNDVSKSDHLISFGINDDWSFESDFRKQHNVPISAFDASVNLGVFVKTAIKNLNRFDKPKTLFKNTVLPLRYLSFFRGETKHFMYFLGVDRKPKYISIATALSEADVHPREQLFFKIDIEGSEYRILDELIQLQNRTSGLVIEFHDCDLHIARIKHFIQAYGLHPIHIHCNNSGTLGLNDVPTVIEMTFSSSDQSSCDAIIPSILDQPNDPNKEEVQITFRDS
ncbi:hypothetical protein OAM78_04105 [Alphaproteobacteria bacterium]|nr:hypothetical protein [Alphaproteobacteria bacterium]